MGVLYFDVTRTSTTNGTPATTNILIACRTVSNQEAVNLVALYGSCRGSAAGGASLLIFTNTGPAVTGGTAQTPAARNARLTAAQMVTSNDITAITAGGTLTPRAVAGMAQTGGQGGWMPVEPGGAIRLQPNGATPVDAEVGSLANGASIIFTGSLEFSEGG